MSIKIKCNLSKVVILMMMYVALPETCHFSQFYFTGILSHMKEMINEERLSVELAKLEEVIA